MNSTKSRLDPTALGARILIGIILILAGSLKASGPREEFAAVIESYGFVSSTMALSLAAFLPWIELFIGYSLLAGYFTLEASACALGLFAAFGLSILSTKVRGIRLPNCGCFGAGIHLSTGQALGLDSAMAALSYFVFRRGPSKPSLDSWVEEQ
jgi:uncharacterized membrane protein YphA (DoxX/SURF4 family)